MKKIKDDRLILSWLDGGWPLVFKAVFRKTML